MTEAWKVLPALFPSVWLFIPLQTSANKPEPLHHKGTGFIPCKQEADTVFLSLLSDYTKVENRVQQGSCSGSRMDIIPPGDQHDLIWDAGLCSAKCLVLFPRQTHGDMSAVSMTAPQDDCHSPL